MLDHPGFLVAIVTVQGVDLIATGIMGTVHNRMDMASRTVTRSRMDLPSRMDMGNRMDTINKMGIVNRMDVQVHAHMVARVHEEDIRARGSVTVLRIIMEPRHQPPHLTKGCTQSLPLSCCPVALMLICRAF